jgi:hypothetical protein
MVIMSKRAFLTATVVAFLVSACGDAFSPESVSGTYSLVTIDGEPLPTTATTTFNGLPVTATVSAGAIALNENGSFNLTLDISAEFGDSFINTTVPDAGTFTLQEPSTIQFISNNVGQLSGTLEGDRLSVTYDGEAMVFER